MDLYDIVFGWLGEVLQSEVMKMTVGFMLAARLHRQWVKKDMAEQFAKIAKSIDHVADVMGRKYDEHEVRIKRLEDG